MLIGTKETEARCWIGKGEGGCPCERNAFSGPRGRRMRRSRFTEDAGAGIGHPALRLLVSVKATAPNLIAIPRGLASIGNMTLARQELADQAASLAVQGVYIGTSSWKYPGWCGMLYDRARYEYRGKFAKSRSQRDCGAGSGSAIESD